MTRAEKKAYRQAKRSARKFTRSAIKLYKHILKKNKELLVSGRLSGKCFATLHYLTGIDPEENNND